MFRLLALLAAFLLSFLPALAQAPRPSSPQQDKDMAELQAYTLTMDKVTRASKATYELGQFSKAHPELKAQMQKRNESGPQGISQMADAMNSVPQAVVILTANGMPRRPLIASAATLCPRLEIPRFLRYTSARDVSLKV